MKSINKYSYFIIFLSDKKFTYPKAKEKIDKIHNKIKLKCQEFTSHNDEFIVINTCMGLAEIENNLKEYNCKIKAIGDKTNLAIELPNLN